MEAAKATIYSVSRKNRQVDLSAIGRIGTNRDGVLLFLSKGSEFLL